MLIVVPSFLMCYVLFSHTFYVALSCHVKRLVMSCHVVCPVMLSRHVLCLVISCVLCSALYVNQFSYDSHVPYSG